MESIRCGECARLLAKADDGAIQGTINIKCPRCGTINHLRAMSPTQERQGAPSQETTS